jgi:hypothetical protein
VLASASLPCSSAFSSSASASRYSSSVTTAADGVAVVVGGSTAADAATQQAAAPPMTVAASTADLSRFHLTATDSIRLISADSSTLQQLRAALAGWGQPPCQPCFNVLQPLKLHYSRTAAYGHSRRQAYDRNESTGSYRMVDGWWPCSVSSLKHDDPEAEFPEAIKNKQTSTSAVASNKQTNYIDLVRSRSTSRPRDRHTS